MEIAQSEVGTYLTHMAKAMPTKVFSRLNLGDRLIKTGATEYEIDDLTLHTDLGAFLPTQVPYGPISRKFGGTEQEILGILNNRRVFPFSEMYKIGKGMCLEKAITFQLASQNVRTSFLVSGCFQEDGGYAALHGFNVIIVDGAPFLVDVENPLARNGDKIQPCIVPMSGMSEDIFKVPEVYRVGRTYSIN